MSTGDQEDHWCWVFPGLSGLRKPQLVEIYENMRARNYGEEALAMQIKHLTNAIQAGRRQYWNDQQDAKQRGDLLPNRAAGTLPNSRDHKQRSSIPAARDRISAREVNAMLRGFSDTDFL